MRAAQLAYNLEEGYIGIAHLKKKEVYQPGWKVPTEADFTILSDYLGGNSVSGGKLKEEGTLHWTTPNTGATNESRFTGLPGGMRQINGDFYIIGGMGVWWNSDEYNELLAKVAYCDYLSDNLSKVNYDKNYGFSVRLVKELTLELLSIILVDPETIELTYYKDLNESVIPALLDYYFDYSPNVTERGFTDIDGNEYTAVTIGTQQWIVENLQVTKYADGSAIPLITINGFNDWYFPSKDELNEMRTVLYLNGIGNFKENNYLSSSEREPTDTIIWGQHFPSNWQGSAFKNAEWYIRPSRSFIDIEGAYTLGQLGPAGGWIYYINGTTYIEASSIDLWGNFSDIDIAIGTTEETIGSGQANTNAILAQSATAPAAKLCNDLSGGWINDTAGAMCYYNNDNANKAIYGGLYNWHAVNNAKGLAYLEKNGVQEAGWRVPTDADFTALSTELGGDTVAGGKMKEIGFTHWETPNTGATNESGFTGLPCGYRNFIGVFDSINTFKFLWSSTENNLTASKAIYLSHEGQEIGDSSANKPTGFSVRLVRTLGIGTMRIGSTFIIS